MNKKNIRAILIVVIAFLVLIGFFIIGALLKKVPSNDGATVGNTAGNLNNHGLFAESNGTVYFSNVYDSGSIYSMKSDESNIKKVNNANSSLICVGGDYLYYYMDTSGGGKGLGSVVKNFGIYRCKTNGKYATSLNREACTAMQLIGDYIYYQNYNNNEYSKVYKIKTDKTDNHKVSDMIFNPSCATNGTIYFNGTEKDHYLYALNTSNDQAHVVYPGNLWYPQYSDGYIYYMDVSSDYRICRYNLQTAEAEVLADSRVDTFNVGDIYIYYQVSDSENPALMRMKKDGSDREMVMEGIFCDINLTSEYVYFRPYFQKDIMYHMPVNGYINVSSFDAAAMAVKK